MSEQIYRGPDPPGWAPEPEPRLPEEALLLLRRVLEYVEGASRRWLIYEDGRVFAAPGSEGPAGPLSGFPTEPTARLDAAQVGELQRRLHDPPFRTEPVFQGLPDTEDGVLYVLTARVDGEQHQVRYYAYLPGLVEYVQGVVQAQASPGPAPQGVHKGPLPAGLSGCVDAVLPDGAFLLFQQISSEVRTNYRWLLYEDGRFFMNEHSWGGDRALAFDTDFPDTPTKRFGPEFVAEVKARLEQPDFFAEEPYQTDTGQQAGRSYCVVARRGGQTHRVFYRFYRPPLVQYLSAIENRFDFGQPGFAQTSSTYSLGSMLAHGGPPL